MRRVSLVILSCCAYIASSTIPIFSSEEYDPDEELTTPQIIRRHGYPSESHFVKTADGYLLTLHRIPCGKNDSRKERKPVFLQHGLLSSSSDWVLMGPNKSLAYILADNGYDVWMGNARGNMYSSGHDRLSEDDFEFWNFTWHEMAIFDLPAAIDYILRIVNDKSLFYVGHSMGTTMFFAMASTKREYGLKVKGMFALAPIAYVGHLKSPVRILSPWANDVEFISVYLGEGAFLPNEKLIRHLAKYGCEIKMFEEKICRNLMFIIAGFDPQQFNMTMLPLILSHAPAGTSTKTIVHYAQEVNSGKFQQFDYGTKGNLIRYGSPDPPEYDLSAVETPVSLHYGDNDWLASVIDVQRLYDPLKRKIGKFLVNFHGFNHIDFVYGNDANSLVYENVLKLMNSM